MGSVPSQHDIQAVLFQDFPAYSWIARHIWAVEATPQLAILLSGRSRWIMESFKLPPNPLTIPPFFLLEKRR